MSIYKGSFIAGSYWAKLYGLIEGWWYTWDVQPIREATETEKRAGDGI